jgi:hypothetical protein
MEKKRLIMRKTTSILFPVFIILLISSCNKDDAKIEYQDGYPNKLAGNWVVFEFSGAEIGGSLYDPYDLVTSLDPNNKGSLIIDKLYDSDVRIRASYDSAKFLAEMSPQLELVSTNTYDIAYVSLDGYVSHNPVIIDAVYRFAQSSFENIGFTLNDSTDVILIHAGYYDKDKNPVDTVLIMGYRKTGFEDVKY